MSFGASTAIQGLSVVTGVLLARILGVEDRGELAAVVLWPSMFASAGSLGITDALTFHASRATAPVRSFFGTAVALALAQGAVLMAIGALLLPFVFAEYDDEALRAAYVFLLHIPLWLVGVYLLSILNGLHRFRAFQVLRFLPIATNVVGLVAVALAHELTVTAATLVYLASDGVAVLAAAGLLVRAAGSGGWVRRGVARSLLGYGVRSHPGSVAAVLNDLVGQLLVSIFLGPVKLGLYVIAVTLSSLTHLVGGSVYMVALPAVARVHDAAERVAATRRYLAITMIVTAAVTIPLVAIAPTLIRLFFGREFAASGNVARILLVATAILGANRTLSAVMRALNKPLAAGVAEFVALLATVSALAVLLPAFGLLGAAWGSVVGACVGTAFMVTRVARALGTPARVLLLPGREPVPAAVAGALPPRASEGSADLGR